ncbi:MAG: hypothetical protein J6B64_00390 [Bacilli bacterium]|nr:hypothetical protein [Bacilli bacterium]MBP3635590.1 hypothetical protein [Bacilli bacterium]
MNKKKNRIIIIMLILVLLILGFVIASFIKSTLGYGEERIVKELTSMGEEIYNDYYYPSISSEKSEEDISNFLKAYERIGLKFNLNELEKYNSNFKEKISKFKNNNKQCNKDDTMVVIYPKSPYGKTDYTLEIKLECGFKN